MFKYSRVSCTPLAPPSKGQPEKVELDFGSSSSNNNSSKSSRQQRTRRRYVSKRMNQVEPTTSKPHDAPMSKGDLYFALDCEMVGVGPESMDSALARVCIVNWENEVVLDTFVKVSVPVTDYRTHVSGVRPEDLTSPDAMEFEDCRLAVKNILCGKILIGHGLENDLKALRLTHPQSDVRDTAAYAPLMRKRVVNEDNVILWPRKLRDLAWEKLERQIQVDGKAHSPLEDAVTALDLYKHVRPTWENDLVKEAMKKEVEAQNERLRLESQMYAASVNSRNMVAHMNNLPHHGAPQGVPVPPNPAEGYKMYYERGYNYQPHHQPVQYIAHPPQEGYPHTVYPPPQQHHQYPGSAPPPPQSSQGSSFFRIPQVLVPVYRFNTKSSRKARRQQQQQVTASGQLQQEQVPPQEPLTEVVLPQEQ